MGLGVRQRLSRSTASLLWSEVQQELNTEDSAGIAPALMTAADPRHSTGESRLVLVGSSNIGRIVVVVHTYRGGWVRPITARCATRRERREYEEGLNPTTPDQGRPR
jgi:uncharacterized DUF497 family protein